MEDLRGPGGVRVTTVTLDAPDPGALADFYARLLGADVAVREADWCVLRLPGVSLGFQREPVHRRPVWPGEPDTQQMQAHLEIGCRDLAEAVAHATACGAVVHEHQPQDGVRVCLDPAGHPFCLWVEEA